MTVKSWVSSKVQLQNSPIHGVGLLLQKKSVKMKL